MDAKQTNGTTLSEQERETIILISFMMNEMAADDGFGTLAGATKIHPKIADLYARYSRAALRGIERYRKL